MPLPPALAARLAKRGLIPKAKETKPSQPEEEEEVFAESYDDHDDKPAKRSQKANPAKLSQDDFSIEKVKYLGYPGCPNKSNPYHECQPFCLSVWGPGKIDPSPEYIEKHEVMMEKYGPLPDGWKEMYDPGTGRHFYWCTRTDLVSWLPPGHPKSKPGEAASRVREAIQIDLQEENDDEDQEMELDSDMESDDDESEDDDDDSEEEQRREPERRPHQQQQQQQQKRRGANLDPMDPAAYSDTPRGNWSTGLEKARESGPTKPAAKEKR